MMRSPFSFSRRHTLLAAAAWLVPAAGVFAQHAGHGEAASSASAPKKSARRPKAALGMGAAVAPDGTLWVVMLDARGRLVVATSTDQGRRFGPPRLLDNAGEPVSADGENHPKIAFGPRGQVVISYTMPLAKPFTGAIRLLRSSDAGASFAPPITVHQDRQEITHRFDSIAFDGRGVLHAVWIDKRDLEIAKAAGRAYAGAAIYRNESTDGGATWGPDRKVADHSCECCRIALAMRQDGTLVALWRHVWPTNLRDHAFAPLTDGTDPAAPRRATFDGWVVAGCPHHGPSLAAAADGGWHAVWFGQRDGVAAVRLGRLGADGAPRAAVRELPDESAEHASVVSLDRRVVVTWRSFDGQVMRWRAWISDDDGATFELRELGFSRSDTDQPRLLRSGRVLLALWRTADEGVRVVAL